MATNLSSFFAGIRIHIPECPTALMLYYLREAAREFCKDTLIWQDDCTAVALAVNTRTYTLTPPADSLLVRAIHGKVKHTASNGAITATTNTDPIVVTSAAHGLAVGARVYIASLTEMTELNDLTHTVYTLPDDDTFSIDIDGTGYTPETTGGTWNSVSAYTDLPPKSEFVLDNTDANWRIAGSGTNYYFYCPDTTTVALSWDPAEAVPNGLVIKAALKPTVTATTVPDVLYDDWHAGIEAGAIGRLLMIPGKAWVDQKSAAVFLAEFYGAKREARGDRLAANTHRATTVQADIGAYT